MDEIIIFITAYNPNYESEELESMDREEIAEIARETIDNFYL